MISHISCLSLPAKNFRSIEEIRQELEGSEIFVKKDIEMITKHVNVLNNSHSSIEEVQHALDELEYYVHQIDNGRDLDTIGGLALVIRFMNSSEESLRRRAAFVVGSAVQRWSMCCLCLGLLMGD